MKKIFLDTTYLLPLTGIETSIHQFNDQFEKTMEDQSILYLYSPASIIELKWIIKKIGKTNNNRQKLEEQLEGVLRMLNTSPKFEKISFVNDIINHLTYKMELLGHSDYFDTLIASSAIISSDLFITEDKKLSNVIPKTITELKPYFNYKIDISTWSNFFSMNS